MAKKRMMVKDLESMGGVSRSTSARIRSDPKHTMNPKTIGKIAKALDVSVEYLTGIER